jgi:hypothetical protein
MLDPTAALIGDWLRHIGLTVRLAPLTVLRSARTGSGGFAMLSIGRLASVS